MRFQKNSGRWDLERARLLSPAVSPWHIETLVQK
jgi:hypothetical protein